MILFSLYWRILLLYLKLDRNIEQGDCIAAKKWTSLNNIMSLEEFAKILP
jgi:hypothetical protein